MLIYESRLIPNLKFRELALDTARTNNIPVQISFIEGGSTDGAAIHLHNIGVPTIVIAVAARHIHSHGSIIHRDDYDNAAKLLVSLIQRLDTATVTGLTV